jgi:hypothetical protein
VASAVGPRVAWPAPLEPRRGADLVLQRTHDRNKPSLTGNCPLTAFGCFWLFPIGQAAEASAAWIAGPKRLGVELKAEIQQAMGPRASRTVRTLRHSRR